MMLGSTPASVTKYIDQVFSIYLYTGTGATRSIVTGVDVSGQGGAIWIKNRDQNDNNWLFATSLGAGTGMRTNSTGEAWGFGNPGLTSFNSDGFTVGTHDGVNGDDENLVSWSWRKAIGAFDTIAYEGTGSTQQISHSLGCKPGMIIVKNRDMVNDWAVWHKGAVTTGEATNTLALNTNAAASTNNTYFDSGSTPPTATNFTVHSSNRVNENDDSYVAYVFAGGEEQGNASVDIDGQNGNYMEWEASSDFVFDGQFCIEYWVYMDDNSGEEQVLSWGTGAYRAIFWTGSTWKIEWPTGNSNFDLGGSAPTGAWKHHVLTRDGSNVVRFFIDGVMQSNQSTSDDIGENSKFVIGIKYNYPSGGLQGKVSNLRLVKGSIPTTYQTSSTTNSSSIFTSPTSPLTTTSQGATASHVKLLCCNDIGASAFTVAPGAIILKGSPHGNGTSSPFAASTATDAGAVFGEDQNKSIMKCGTYIGNGSATGNEVDIGFEPQYILIKRIDTTETWDVYDSMRGIATSHNDQTLRPDSSALEYSYSRIDLTPRGFIPMTDNNYTNADGGDYIYFCVRRPDGVVGKPAEAGTDVFNIVNGDTDGVDPFFKNIGFPVDLGLFKKKTDASHNWGMSQRLTQTYYLSASDNRSENYNSHQMFDYMSAWNSGTDTGGGYFTYAWKRHAGFDVVTWSGTNSSVVRRHNLGRTPEMIWYKNRSSARDWKVYHKGLNGGTYPEDYDVELNTANGQASNTNYMTSTAPTSTTFVAGNDDDTNGSGSNYIAMLFASVSGISSVGSYTGSGSSATQTITIGFQPRFVMIKDYTGGSNPWYVMDTLRGWASGDDKQLMLDSTSAELTNDWGAPTSTGFTVTGNGINNNSSTNKYIYYAHA